jgi:hypothetical protein
MAERTGLEPATPGVTGRYSNQLNYRSAFPASKPCSALPLGEAHFNDFFSYVKRLGKIRQYFFILIKKHTTFVKNQRLSHFAWNLSTDVIVLDILILYHHTILI